ncbi:decapping nuclease DXO homolog [Drosophila grimshawi]|uniref:Decapping nuclease n=1 Tax=Drosophila grimshawi TaxID=7222 RepID=B4JKN0_DROGR|nr:decapping nuclease DXO homolog [Drosophila grimshawi]EDW00133.1 GH12029 [Drosophila grimshawi]
MSTGDLGVNVRLHKLGSKFDGEFPHFSRPDPIGFYSVDEAGEFQDNASNLTYLRLPHISSLPLDLNAGIEKVQRKRIDSDYRDIFQLCQYIYNHQELLRKSSTGCLVLSADFVTLRGILRQIMCTPYEINGDYRLMATRLNGTIYISKMQTDEHIKREQLSRKMKNMCSWGFKFEQYCSTSNPAVAPDTNEPVNEAKEFACIFRSKLNGLRLMYCAEMDCIKSDVQMNLSDPKQLRAAEFIELKTTTNKMNGYCRSLFNNYKSCNWWSQSFLVGIATIIAGKRDNKGLTHVIQEYSVGELHRNKPWSAAAMTIFLSDFLHALKTLMEHIDDPHAVLMLEYKDNQKKVMYTVIEDEPLLPEWYRQLMHGKK